MTIAVTIIPNDKTRIVIKRGLLDINFKKASMIHSLLYDIRIFGTKPPNVILSRPTLFLQRLGSVGRL